VPSAACASRVPDDGHVRVVEWGLPVAGDTAPASAFTQLFAASRQGWTGGDGTFSVRLPDGRTAWLFGDSFVGGRRRRGAAWRSGPAVGAQQRRRAGRRVPDHRARPDGGSFLPSPEGTVLWPSQAVVEGETVRAFFSRVRTGPACST
jgi:hypothetical protein